MADKNKVIQLLDPETGGKVSPVVNVGSIYDKKGQKIDNLLSYKVSGMDVPIPEAKNMTDEINKKVDDTLQNVNSKVDNKLASVDDAITKAGSVIKNATIPSNISAINAGDVVDVDSSGNVFRNFISEDNSSKMYAVASSSVVASSRLVKMSDKFTIGGMSYGSSYGEAYLINNETKQRVSTLSVSSYYGRGMEIIRIDDTTALMFYAEFSNQTYLKVYQVSIQESSGSYSLTRTNYWSLLTIGSGYEELSMCQLNSDTFALALNSSSSAVSIMLIKISDGVPSVLSSPVKLKSFQLDMIKLSDLGGNKFVVSGNYGNSVNLFTFKLGDGGSSVSDIIDIGISSTAKYIGHCKTSENSIVISYLDSVSSVEKSVLQKIDFTGTSTKIHDPVYVNEGTLGYTGGLTSYYKSTIVPTGRDGEFISFHLTTNNSEVRRITVNDELTISEPYNYSGASRKGYAVACLYISDSFIPILYFSYDTTKSSTDGYYGMYHYFSLNPVTRVPGGDFVDKSRDAIALKNGVSGSTIPLGFHGICEMPSAKTGDSIKSVNGVSGISPADGLMIISSKYEHPEGSYLGTGKHSASDPVVLEFDVLPRRIDIINSTGTYHGVILIYNNGEFCYGFYEQIYDSQGNTINAKITVDASGSRVSFYGYQPGRYTLDEAGVTYHYTAFN